MFVSPLMKNTFEAAWTTFKTLLVYSTIVLERYRSKDGAVI